MSVPNTIAASVPPRKPAVHAAPPLDRLIQLSTVCALLGISKTTVYEKLRSDATFPKSKKVGTRAVRWSEQAVKAWRDALPEYQPISRVMPKHRRS